MNRKLVLKKVDQFEVEESEIANPPPDGAIVKVSKNLTGYNKLATCNRNDKSKVLQVLRAGICHSDLHIAFDEGSFPAEMYPTVMGAQKILLNC